jgi:hypothetical protein
MINYYQKNKDLKFGFNSEDLIKPILEKFFNKKLKKSEEFKSYDYKAKNLRIELKTRRIKSTDYDDSFLCENKIKYGLKTKKDFYIVFKFIDGLFYIHFSKEFLNYEKVKMKVHRGDIVVNYKIPVNHLTKINI